MCGRETAWLSEMKYRAAGQREDGLCVRNTGVLLSRNAALPVGPSVCCSVDVHMTASCTAFLLVGAIDPLSFAVS